MSCSTCDGYEFVPGPDEKLVHCPDCHPTDDAFFVCSIHGTTVPRDPVSGRLRGSCPGCVRDYQAALAWLETHPTAVALA